MNKNQGFAIGAILVAGLVIHSLATGPTEVRESARTTQTAAARPKSASPSDAIGPWIASCNYWAAMSNYSANVPPRPHPPAIRANGFELTFSNEEDELGCANENKMRWGFPKESRGIEVRAIIATVPDPVHTHLAMEFDRTVVALLLAAQANGYLSSYFWVPWKRQPLNWDRATEAAESEEAGHDPARERQPGLLVLKSGQDPKRLLYVFLVGESPSEGINGFQMRAAFQYEKDLAGILQNGQFSVGRTDNEVSIVGPIFSGSAASLRAAIDTESGPSTHSLHAPNLPRTFHVTGSTSTVQASNFLVGEPSSSSAKIEYLSFDAAGDFTECEFFRHLQRSGYDPSRIAILTETSTLFAASYSGTRSSCPDLGRGVLQFPFPREISLLRNAQEEAGIERNNPLGGANIPGRYLHLTLRDNSPADSVPQFSRENTPLSQEAQLMEIARQLHRLRIQYVAIVSSNPLDQIFLAQFLHRSCPDTRLFSYGGDLLLEREADNVPFIGTTTVTPFTLMGLSTASSFPDAESITYYNAFSSQFWTPLGTAQTEPSKAPAQMATSDNLAPTATSKVPMQPVPLDEVSQPGISSAEVRSHFNGYSQITLSQGGAASIDREDQPKWQPLLWATTIGLDGYYPVAILNSCTSQRPENSPAIAPNGHFVKSLCFGEDPANPGLLISFKPQPNQPIHLIFPSLLWELMSLVVGALCLTHALALLLADYWSPVTRDLMIQRDDEPRRRAMYLNVAMVMLFSMACVCALPAVLIPEVPIAPEARAIAAFTLAAGLVTCVVSCLKTVPWSGPEGIDSRAHETHWPARFDRLIEHNTPFLVNIVALTAIVAIPWSWWLRCTDNYGQMHIGLFFCYRCINPGSGVSPLVPVLLLLFAWYVWANCQTRRLRFSEMERPRLPSAAAEDSEDNRYFITDEELSGLKPHGRYPLYRNICSLLITRESLRHVIHDRRLAGRAALDLALLLVYLTGLAFLALHNPIRSLNHFLWPHRHLADPYEILIGLLFYPLLAVLIAGWLRMLLIWAALRNGLLIKLENLPIRLAFSRLKGFGWMGMLRQSGIPEQLRDRDRSVESISYVRHEEDVQKTLPPNQWLELDGKYASLKQTLHELRKRIMAHGADSKGGEPGPALSNRLERELSSMCRFLLGNLLIPYWRDRRVGLVDGVEVEELPMKERRWHMEGSVPPLPIQLQATPEPADPPGLMAAQEFVALRYVALIRAVLANIRTLMAFVSITFVLSIVAWHSYPFQASPGTRLGHHRLPRHPWRRYRLGLRANVSQSHPQPPHRHEAKRARMGVLRPHPRLRGSPRPHMAGVPIPQRRQRRIPALPTGRRRHEVVMPRLSGIRGNPGTDGTFPAHNLRSSRAQLHKATNSGHTHLYPPSQTPPGQLPTLET